MDGEMGTRRSRISKHVLYPQHKVLDPTNTSLTREIGVLEGKN